MQIKTLLLTAGLILVLLAGACVPATPVIPQTGPDATATQVPGDLTITPIVETPGVDDQVGTPGGATAPGVDELGMMDENLQDRVVAFVANQLNVSAADINDIELLSAFRTDFTDSCLGMGGIAESCAQVMTQGWRVVVMVDGSQYVVHTNMDGSNIRINTSVDDTGDTTGGPAGGVNQGGTTGGTTGGANQGDTTGGVLSLDQILIQSMNTLSQNLNIPLNQISLSSLTVEQWPDACLGLGQNVSGETCAQVVTPGYRLVFNVAGQNYELRTDSTGQAIRLVQGTQP